MRLQPPVTPPRSGARRSRPAARPLGRLSQVIESDRLKHLTPKIVAVTTDGAANITKTRDELAAGASSVCKSAMTASLQVGGGMACCSTWSSTR